MLSIRNSDAQSSASNVDSVRPMPLDWDRRLKCRIANQKYSFVQYVSYVWILVSRHSAEPCIKRLRSSRDNAKISNRCCKMSFVINEHFNAMYLRNFPLLDYLVRFEYPAIYSL